jgi:hypothetical protein
MRWFTGILLVLVLAVAAYLGSLLVSLNGLISAVRTANGAEVAARTDMVRLRRSLRDQIVGAYLRSLGNPKPLQMTLANTYGSTIVDAMLEKFLTPENITKLLQAGSARDGNQNTTWSMPPLGAIDGSRIADILGRIRPIQVLTVEIRTSDQASADAYSAVALHLESDGWKLAGLVLPADVLRGLAAKLPAR